MLYKFGHIQNFYAFCFFSWIHNKYLMFVQRNICFILDVFGWPQPSCSFPAWVTGYSWRDLSGTRTYTSNTAGSVLSVRHTQQATSNGKYTGVATSTIREAFRCLSLPRNTPSNNQDTFIALSHSSDDWWVNQSEGVQICKNSFQSLPCLMP